MSMDLEDRQQEFIKSASYVQEVGETFAMNRILRRELVEMQRIVVQSTQQSYKDVEQLKGAMHTLLQLQKEIVASAAQIPRPAPPPPDYVGLGHSALAMFKDIGVALINRGTSPAGNALEGKAAAAQMPVTQSTSGESQAGTPAPDVLTKLVNKLQGLSEIELAACMNSPESWKALLDACRSSMVQPTAPVSEAESAPAAS